jgi:hypothetical protein
MARGSTGSLGGSWSLMRWGVRDRFGVMPMEMSGTVTDYVQELPGDPIIYMT